MAHNCHERNKVFGVSKQKNYTVLIIRKTYRNEMDCSEIAENCRACQIRTHRESQIFMFATTNLPDIYQETTSLDIYENDGLPGVLCFACYNRLLEAYNFRKMCFAAALHFQQILSMDIPEEKYTPPEHLSDPLMATKPDPDDSDSSNSLPEKKYTPPEKKFHPPEVSVELTVDEKPLAVAEESVGDDSLEKPRRNKRTVRKQEKRSPPSTKNTSITPGNTKKPKKRKCNHECDICHLKFDRKDYLKQHMMVKHEGLKACECQICGRGFTRTDSLKGHMESVHGAKRKFQCPETGCRKQYETEEGLQKHLKSWHDPENPRVKAPSTKVFVCEVCGKEYKENYLLKQHSYSHGVVKPHACTKCPRRFPTQNQLKLHTMRHEGIKNFKCKVCGLEKVTARELRIHMNTHTKEITWPCKFCPSTFTQQENLKRHIRVVHQGVKDFHCPHCEKSFGKAETLKHHVMTHTGEMPHACGECGKRFIQKTALKTHMKTHLKYK